MAHHKSTMKRIKTNLKANIRNRHYRSLMRTAVRRIGETEETGVRAERLHSACAIIDRLASKGIIHRIAASRSKSRLHRRYSGSHEK